MNIEGFRKTIYHQPAWHYLEKVLQPVHARMNETTGYTALAMIANTRRLLEVPGSFEGEFNIIINDQKTHNNIGDTTAK